MLEGAHRPESPRVLFVCTGAPADGLGHLTRTMAVAAATAAHAQVLMLTVGAEAAANLLGGTALPHRVVDTIASAAEAARDFSADVVVFDLLRMPAEDFAAISAGAPTVSLSPVFDRLGDVDVVFHRTEKTDPSWRAAGDRPDIRAGLGYAVIDDRCARIPTATYQQSLARPSLSVAVSMGGADAANKTLEVVRTLIGSESRLLLWVLLGEGYGHSYQDLVDCTRGARHEIILAKTNESMWHILGTCSLCVLAGGTTTYQAAYAGLPSIDLLDSPARSFLIDELVERGACLKSGDTLADSLGRLNGLVGELEADRSRLLAMHEASLGLIDGRGAARIAEQIVAMAAAEPGAKA